MVRFRVARSLTPAWLVSALLFMSCGSDNDSTPKTPFETFAEEAADTICSAYLACNCLQQEGLAECEARLGELITLRAAFVMSEWPGMQFDQANADACLAQFSSAVATCPAQLPEMSGCDVEDFFFVGMQGLGEPCTDTRECTEGLGCNILTATCDPLAAAGEDCTYLDCAEGLRCDSSGNVCIALSAVDEPCIEDEHCQAGLICYAPPLGSGPTICHWPHTLGTACGDDGDCVAGAYCPSATKICTAALADGEDCTSEKQCASGRCDTSTTDTCVAATFCGSIEIGFF